MDSCRKPLTVFLFFIRIIKDGRVAQWLERFSDKEEVEGSIPSMPTIHLRADSSIGGAPVLHTGG